MGYGGFYSEQEAMNILYNGNLTGLSLQAVANRQSGYTDHQYSFQTILNRNLGVADTTYTTQEALWLTLQGDLGLTGNNHFQYSIQTLLNMALGYGTPDTDSDVTLPEVLDTYSGLLLAIAYA